MTEPQRAFAVGLTSDAVKAIINGVWLRDVDLSDERTECAWDTLTHGRRDAALALAEVRALRLELQALRVVIEGLAGDRNVDEILAGVDEALASTRASMRDAHTE